MTQHTRPSRRRRRMALAVPLTAALVCAATACSAGSVTPTSTTTSASVARFQLARLARQDVAAGAPGVLVRVDDGHGSPIQIARQAAWSVADHKLGVDDQFKMGSNSKTMVATVILQLVAEHRIELTDPVDKWLPGLVPNGHAITLGMLLNHTSGLFNHSNDPAVLKTFTGQDTRQWTPQELVAAAVEHGPLFAPGARFSYSNTNYVTLGLVAEKATGQRLADLIQQRIVKRLHLEHTYLSSGVIQPTDPHLAHGYEPDAAHLGPVLPAGTPPGTHFVGGSRADGYVDVTRIGLTTEAGAGGVISTADDWARFDKALLSGRLLPRAQMREMRTTVSEGSSTPNRYGLGLEQIVTPCGTAWGHGGQVPGYSSEDYTDGTGQRTVSVFTSTIFGLASPRTGRADQALVNAAVCAMFDKPVPRATASSS
ncbi:serine hydrolase domain-containing protein [Streptomyces silvisoli]|uniref:Serine hydrolase n=1 Tax=Streptomyces silvisoli TaxID=3034235 RepID=A0ABT5ZE26_9ACTN|nr:serine hydrolase domain-containing protein [Streptomyces silvisoli]MDF3288082.1 serine hydrolase [Streptomyces silvisoli]